jgi:capsular polysaccharide export protein
MRQKRVYTYGMPFYAGWGLTKDQRTCARRTRQITLDELVAAALILYPRYISPKTHALCEPEQMLEELIEEQERYEQDRLYQYWMRMRGYILPRIRRMIRMFTQPLGLKI